MAKRRHNGKKLIPIVRTGELATPERYQKSGGVITEIIDRDASGKILMKRQRVRIECMLDYYFNAFRINERQYKAGLKFREIFLHIHYDTNCTALRLPFLKYAKHAYPEGKMLAHLDCLHLLDEAYKQLSPEQLSVIRKVCGYDEYAGTYAKMKTLVRGLDILASWWNYI